MKKLICILLIISIITYIFADNIIFEQGKQDEIKIKKISLFAQGYIDGKESASVSNLYVLLMMLVMSLGNLGIMINMLLEKKAKKPSYKLYKKINPEYIKGFDRAYSKEVLFLINKKIAPIISILFFAMSIAMIFMGFFYSYSYSYSY